MVVIADGKPQQLGLMEIIRHYVAYQQKVIKRRTLFDLEQAQAYLNEAMGMVGEDSPEYVVLEFYHRQLQEQIKQNQQLRMLNRLWNESLWNTFCFPCLLP